MAMFEHDNKQVLDFDAIRLKLASPDAIHSWSNGEVTKPETINYRTQKPEKDGLFCERIFGPTKDWECYCGKYKRIRYKGIVCDKCGVEVTRSLVRRERMGHIDLAVPVSHIWFLRGVPSKIGLILDLSVQDLERVIYFASFIILSVDEDLRSHLFQQVEEEMKAKRKQIENTWKQEVNRIKSAHGKDGAPEEVERATRLRDERLKELEEAAQTAKKELKDLRVGKIISESEYQDMTLKYGQVFEAGIGAEAIRTLLEQIDVAEEIKRLEEDVVHTIPSKRRRTVKRLKLFQSLLKNNIRPEWMILTTIPVIPPDLRPMVQLDGGRFAASDLNDLYRRVINRNNRLKKLMDLNAPEVITRNEKRMLQEAVDALIDNSARHGKTVTASTGQRRQLKSLADILKGKQGRFRQNLLGKRVDYSGRSVIVVGPHLELHQCGLPKTMALELFKPFVIAELIKQEHVHNVRSANRFIETGRAEVWDILEKVTKNSHVLLNRAPTLHRLGIQAFQPILIEGKAIQVHPLVCPAFNADFDGDQMAVHVPLVEPARREAAEIMLSSKNILKPATGIPVASPNQDIVLGIYFLTLMRNEEGKDYEQEKIPSFSNEKECLFALGNGVIHLQDPVRVRLTRKKEKGKVVVTTAGRILFNRVVPVELPFVNKTMDSGALKKLVSEALEYEKDPQTIAAFLDRMKNIAQEYVTMSGYSWGMDDLPDLSEKRAILEEGEREILEIEEQFSMGLLTDDERHSKVIEVWAQVKERITKLVQHSLSSGSSIHSIITSGARGSIGQLTQMVGMKGLVTNPTGDTIELPVKASFKEGFDVLEYFISTHGTRKGLADTALRTANAGYLTRRLIDVAQDIVIIEERCSDTEGVLVTQEDCELMHEPLADRVKGRTVVEDVVHPKTGKVIVPAGEIVDDKRAREIAKAGIQEMRVYTVMTCKTLRGLCSRCYGWDLGYNEVVKMGTAVGIVAAQSIGEPGTQLTMRTFHTGGVAGKDITQGLPRVEEIFEARKVKKAGLIAPLTGQVHIVEDAPGEGGIGGRQRTIVIKGTEIHEERIAIREEDVDSLEVGDGASVKKGDVLLKQDGKKVLAPFDGILTVDTESNPPRLIISQEREVEKELPVPSGYQLYVRNGDLVEKGTVLTEGSLDLHELYALKGQEEVQKYILREIQYIYSSQGQKLNDKHVEVIIRQMFSRMQVVDPGDSAFIAGETVDWFDFEEEKKACLDAGKRPPKGVRLLLGITKASLSTPSFLSAASFQETARVLIDAAVTGKVDRLRGLKENVIIGRLIPAGTGFHMHQGEEEAASVGENTEEE